MKAVALVGFCAMLTTMTALMLIIWWLLEKLYE